MEPSTGTGSDLRSDAELIVASRAGDAGAFGALYERHAGAALVVARQYISGAAEAEDVVADAFAAVWTALRGGSGPTDAFRAYLFTVVRRVAAVHREKGRRTEPTDDVAVFESGGLAEPGAEEPALAGFERSVVARAFAGLPERWQAVLWHSEVEGLTPAEIAPLLGLSANSTAALAYRAREGLRQAYLQHHLHEPLDDACRAIAGKLGGYVRDGLGQRDTAQVEAHLEGCGTCRGLVLELRDVNHGLRAIVAPLVLGVVGLGALQYGLPTSGGLAAGSASLASGGATGGAAGAGATAGAGTAGAGAGAGTGAVAAAGVGAAGAVGTGMAAGAAGASGGAAAGGLFAAITGVLAGVPTAVVAAVAGVVVVGGVAFGVTQLGGGGDEGAAPGPSASATSGGESGSGSTLGSTSGPDASSTADSQVPGGDDSPVSDDEQPGDASGSGGSSGGSGAGSGTGSNSAPGGSGGQPTAPATVTPTAPPTTPPAPRPTRLGIGEPQGVLAAGSTGQTLAVDVTNAGDEPATNVYAVVDLPDGVSAGALAGRLSGRFALRTAGAWACLPAGGDVRCTLPVLGGGERARVELTVDVDESFDADGGDVTWQVGADGIEPVSHPTRVPVTPAPARLVVAGHDGLTLESRLTTQVEVPVRNAGGVAAANATVLVDVPDGLTIAGDSDVWTCAAVEAGLSCTTPNIGPRATVPLSLTVATAWSATSGTLGLTLTPGSSDRLDYTVVPQPAPGLRYESGVGRFGVTEIGAPLLGCTAQPSFRECWGESRDNNSYGAGMAPVKAAVAPDGATSASSSSQLDVPEGATVTFAGLYWSANRGPGDAPFADTTTARLRAPGGEYVTVTGTTAPLVTDNANRQYYQSFADVTDLVATQEDPTGFWSVADVAVSTGRTDRDPTYYAGWSLVVAYSHSDAARSEVSVYDGPNWVAANSSVTLPVRAGAGAQVRVGVVAWEGDRASTGDTLSLDGDRLVPWRYQGAGSPTNAFDSSAYGFGYPNSLGVDAKGFGTVTARGDTAVLTAATAGDQYLLGAVTVRVTD